MTAREIDSMLLLYGTIAANVWFFLNPIGLSTTNGYYWHSHKQTTISSAIVSMFTHSTWDHLIGNMIVLWVSGRQVFHSYYNDNRHHDTSSSSGPFLQRPGPPNNCNNKKWSNRFAFIFIYFGSEIATICGCRLISYLLDKEWSNTLRQNRKGKWKWLHPFVDTYSYLTHGSDIVNKWSWELMPIVGASGAICGVVGANMYTALYSSNHPQADTQQHLYWAMLVVAELSQTPFTLNQISSALIDNVDHASHFFGFIGGFSLAAIWDHIVWKDCNNERQRQQRRRY